ncbi:MAG TPA: acyl-CoA synthetase [Acidimicrobiia bacterium]|nr:acyl-CoA synthetase [Acidimicrobiia bacterium]
MEYNLADLWEAVVDAVPEREALICGDRRLSYAAADDRMNRLAHVLRARGIGAGDHVALYLYNGTEYLEAMVAAWKIRAVPVNVNYRYVEDELRYLLADSDAKAVVFHREFAPKLAAIRDQLPELTTLVALEDGSGADLDALGALDYDTALAAAPGGRDFEPRSADDLYVIYTGGTTGMPKGVMWRHEDIFFGAFGGGGVTNPITRPEEISDRARAGITRCLPACPFMHGTGHWMAFMSLYEGGSVVISPERSLDAVHIWELVARERVNFLVVVGDAMARPLVEALDTLDPSVDVSSLVIFLSGGAILSPAVKQALAEKLPGTAVIDGFGSSEAGSQGQMVTRSEGDAPSQPRFVVSPETTVLTHDFRPAEVGVVGKLARRGHVPLGYYNDPVKTAQTFPVMDGVRWSVPGDDARIETDGTITVLGRGSVSINSGGEKVYPEEVEGALKSHPAVFDVVVVGVPDERWGERVVAVVQLREGAPAPTLEELDDHARHHVAGYKVPRAVVYVDHVLRSPSGKPDYRWGRQTAMRRLGIPEPVTIPAP